MFVSLQLSLILMEQTIYPHCTHGLAQARLKAGSLARHTPNFEGGSGDFVYITCSQCGQSDSRVGSIYVIIIQFMHPMVYIHFEV